MAVGCIVDDAAGVLKGDALCLVGWDGGTNKPKVARATRAALLTSKTVYGIAEDDAADTDPIQVLVAGDAARDTVTSLGAGTSRIIATDLTAAAAGDQCRLIRVASPNGSEYVVGTCDENGNLSVVPRASRETSSQHVFNVRAYGALGDASTDDTQAILDTVAAAEAAGGGTVFFPQGTYRVARAGDAVITAAATTVEFAPGAILHADNTLVTIGGAIRAPDVQQIFTGGAYWAANQSGAGPRLTATPTSALWMPASTLVVRISTGGGLGAGELQVSLDGGVNFDAAVQIPGPAEAGDQFSTYAVPGTDIALTFYGTYVLNTEYAWVLAGTLTADAGGPSLTLTPAAGPGLSGTMGQHDVAIRIVDAGLRGVATFQYSFDDGVSWWPILPELTAATYDLAPAGVTIAFGDGATSYVAGAIYRFVTRGPVALEVGATSRVSPGWWGANGDGTTDCTSAIQAALGALPSEPDQIVLSRGGSVVHLPPGAFVISWEIALPENVPLIFEGEGRNVTTIRQTVVANGIASRYPWLVTSSALLTIRDLTLTNEATRAIVENYPVAASGQVWRPETGPYAAGSVVAPPGPSNRLLVCTTGGTTGKYTPFGELWWGVPSDPRQNAPAYGITPGPRVRIEGTPNEPYEQIVIAIGVGGELGTMNFQWSTDGVTFNGADEPTTANDTSYPLGITGLSVVFEDNPASYTSGYYASPPKSTGFSIIVGDVISDSTAEWRVIDGGCGILQENGGNVFIERVGLGGWITGICFDQTEGAAVSQSGLSAANAIWIVNANERSNAATAPAQPGDSTNGISITDCVIDATMIGIVDSGGIGHQIERCIFEGSGAHELPSWQGWLVGTSRAKVSGWSAEGATHGFFVGSQAPFTGVPIYPNASLTFTECVIAPGGDGPCFEAPTCSGVPFLELALRNCYFSWKGTHGFTDCVQGNGLRLEDNQYGTGSLATFFDTTPPWGTPLVIEQTASGATGLTINALPAINGVDNGAQFALRNASLTLANGQNDDVPNPGTASAEIVGPDADFEVSGVAGGTDGQILELVYANPDPNPNPPLDFTILHQNASSAAANQIACPAAADVVLSAVTDGFAWARLKYSAALGNGKWMLLGHS